MKTKILIVTLLVFSTAGCSLFSQDRPPLQDVQGISPNYWLRRPLPAEEAEPVTYEKKVVPEGLPPDDFREIVTLLSSIPHINWEYADVNEFIADKF